MIWMGGLPLAHEALVFMIESLSESWKLPLKLSSEDTMSHQIVTFCAI